MSKFNIGKFLYCFFTVLGTLMLGSGTLLLGAGGLLALSKADTVLNNVLEIKEVLSLMRQEQKFYFARKFASNNDVILSKDASLMQIKSALSTIPNDTVGQKGFVILKKDNVDSTAKAIYDTKDLKKRVYILENSLEYKPPKSN